MSFISDVFVNSEHLKLITLLEEKYGLDISIEIMKFFKEKNIKQIVEVYISSIEKKLLLKKLLVNQIVSEKHLFAGSNFTTLDKILERNNLNHLHVFLICVDAVVGKYGYTTESVVEIIEEMDDGVFDIFYDNVLNTYIMHNEVFSYYARYKTTKKALEDIFHTNRWTTNKILEGRITPGIEKRRQEIINSAMKDDEIIKNNHYIKVYKKLRCTKTVYIENVEQSKKNICYEIKLDDYFKIINELDEIMENMKDASEADKTAARKKYKKKNIKKYGIEKPKSVLLQERGHNDENDRKRNNIRKLKQK